MALAFRPGWPMAAVGDLDSATMGWEEDMPGFCFRIFFSLAKRPFRVYTSDFVWVSGRQILGFLTSKLPAPLQLTTP